MKRRIRDIVIGISFVLIAVGIFGLFGTAGAVDAETMGFGDPIGVGEMIKRSVISLVLVYGGVSLNTIGGGMDV